MGIAQTDVPVGLNWLRGLASRVAQVEKQAEENRKTAVGLRMRCASLEEGVRQREKDNAELRSQLSEAESQLDSSAADMKSAIRGDVDSDLEILASRDRALATALTLVAARVMQSGVQSLERLGLSDDVVRTVNGMVNGFAAANSVPPVNFTDNGNGLRYSDPPVSAYQSAPQPRNSMTFAHISAEEREAIVHTEELEVRQLGGAERLVPRRAYG